MSEAPAAIGAVHGPIAAEDQARANFYALLARLYDAAPDATLLASIAAAEELPVSGGEGAGRDLAQSWHALIAASATADPGAAADEFQNLFIGVGKSAVSLHASAYVSRTGRSLLADLRTTLSGLGLGRHEAVNVYEDHLAAICEAMRVLISGAPGIDPGTVAQQCDFFAVYVLPWADSCCNAIKTSPVANYYRWVAEFTQCFVAIERDSFAIE